MRLLVFLAVWKRPEITEICFMGLRRLRKNSLHPIEVLAVISEESMIPLCRKYDIRWTFYKNEPLGEKKNYGLTEAMKLEWDYLIEIGSDDLLKDELITTYSDYFGKYDMFGTKDSVIINSEDGKCNRLKSDTPFGLGRCIKRSVIEKHCHGVDVLVSEGLISTGRTTAKGQVGFFKIEQAEEIEKLGRGKIVSGPRYKMWKDELNRSLDNSSNYYLLTLGVGYKTVKTEKPLTIDIKSKENIWPFSEKVGVKYDIEKALEGLSQEEQNALCVLWKGKVKRNIEYANHL